jgi:hypothetical protein
MSAAADVKASASSDAEPLASLSDEQKTARAQRTAVAHLAASKGLNAERFLFELIGEHLSGVADLVEVVVCYFRFDPLIIVLGGARCSPNSVWRAPPASALPRPPLVPCRAPCPASFLYGLMWCSSSCWPRAVPAVWHGLFPFDSFQRVDGRQHFAALYPVGSRGSVQSRSRQLDHPRRSAFA